MNTYHGKKIAELWLPGEGNAYDQKYKAKDELEMELFVTAQDESWIVIKEKDVETRRINSRQVTEIVWA